MAKVLIVDDEKELAEVLSEYLKVEGFETMVAYDGMQGLACFMEFEPDLMVLDIMLPGKNGVEVLKEIRTTSKIPVIMLSAKNGEMDKVISLGAGADDYVTKPFSPLELVARVKAHCRRYQSYYEEQASSVAAGVCCGRIRMYPDSYETEFDGIRVELSSKEFEMLWFFVQNTNHVFSKEQLYQKIWGMNEYGDIGTVAVYIKKLRDKMNEAGFDYIKTIWGVGYKLVPDDTGME